MSVGWLASLFEQSLTYYSIPLSVDWLPSLFERIIHFMPLNILLLIWFNMDSLAEWTRSSSISTSTKYWPPSISWRLCQRLFYFYQILTTFNKLKIISDVVLLLPNTDCLQEVEDYVRGCSISTKYWLSAGSWRLCQRLFYFYQILSAFNKLEMASEVSHHNVYILLEFRTVLTVGYLFLLYFIR